MATQQSGVPVPVLGGSSYSNVTASGLVAGGDGFLTGIFVASASATPTIKLWDALTAVAPVLINTFTPSAGTWYPIPAHFKTGLFITIGGTVDCTVIFQ